MIKAKFQLGHPQEECQSGQIQVEWVKIGDCRPTSRYISETVEDRDQGPRKVTKSGGQRESAYGERESASL